MNTFMQEYGLVVVAVIIVLAFIGVANIFSDQVSEAVKDILATFFAKTGISTT